MLLPSGKTSLPQPNTLQVRWTFNTHSPHAGHQMTVLAGDDGSCSPALLGDTGWEKLDTTLTS